MVTGRSGVNIERPCHSCQWGDVTFGGSPPHSVLETLRLRSGRTEFPSPGDGFRLGRYRLGGGVRLQEGWIPASAGKTDGGGVGGERDVLAELGRLSLDPSTRLPPRRMFHPRQGERRRARRWIPASRLGWSRLGGGVRLQEGWIPASAGKTDGGGWGGETEAGVRSGLASRSRPLCERLPCSLHHRACSTAPCRGRTACSRAGPV